jgi:hypothetical protein
MLADRMHTGAEVNGDERAKTDARFRRVPSLGVHKCTPIEHF